MEEILELKNKYEEAKTNREITIIDHLYLVSDVIDNNFINNYDQEELYQIGVLGLIEAVDNFSTSNKKRFNCYAKAIIKKKINEYVENSCNIQVVNYDTINEAFIDDNVAIEYNYEIKEESQELRKYVYNLPYFPREVIKMYYGFYGYCYSFKEIALIFDVKEQQIKSLIARELRTIRKLISTNKMDSKIKKISKVK